MRQIPKAKTKDEVDFIFGQLLSVGDDNINGKNVIYFYFLKLYYYKINQLISKI
jgi:hypothetical protein